MMRAALVLVALASCAPDPFGVDCRTSPSCQKREAKKQAAAQADHKKSCEAQHRTWIAGETAASSLECDPAKAACESVYGCWQNAQCVESMYCLEGDTWSGYCATCADRALMDAENAKVMAKIQAEETARKDALALAESESKQGKCSDKGRTIVETGLAGVEKDWPHKGTPVKNATTLAPTKAEAEAVAGQRFTITVVGVPRLQIEPAGADFHSGSLDETQAHEWVRESTVATGNTVGWSIKTTGCVAWRIVRE